MNKKRAWLLCFLFVTACAQQKPRSNQWARTPASEAEEEEIEAMINTSNQFRELYRAPKSGEDHTTWLNALKHVRDLEWKSIRANRPGMKSVHQLPSLQWTDTNFVHAQMMVQDRYFFDVITGKYTVKKYLEDLKARYGGIDSVLIWQNYPNIGVDERNQFDMMRDLPGGYAELKRVIAELKKNGVRVMLPLNPWDHGTREEGDTQPDSMAKMIRDLGADGMNGDTMVSPEYDYFEAGLKLNYPFAIQPEAGLSDDISSILWVPLSWGYWKDYDRTMGVDRYKWLEPRHRTHVNLRDAHNHVEELQHAFFNGAGFHSWENVWGIWNGMTERDGESLKRITSIYRMFPSFLVTDQWIPYTPTLQDGVYASSFQVGNQKLYTLVNRTKSFKNGKQIKVNPKGKYFDLWRGTSLIVGSGGVLNFNIEPDGFGAILALDENEEPGAEIEKFLAETRAAKKKEVSEFSAEWSYAKQTIVPIEKKKGSNIAPEGMTLIPAVRDFNFEVSGIEVEDYDGVDVQYPWEDHPVLEHEKQISINSFYLDKNLVTNKQFKEFLTKSGYKPRDSHSFLRDWPNGMLPLEMENRPVTWVSLEDARAYAKWAGKRLPHEWEWQYAAQGTDGRLFPWGKTFDARKVPATGKNRERRLPDAVGSFPMGASPFGILDLVGNVWQWTDEFQDEHTRAAIIRGGSYYHPQGSEWYFPQTYQLDQHGKYLLMAPSLDRSGTIGFRCAVDL